MKSALIDKLKQKMEETHTGATALEKLTGIPKARIYKWLDENGKPSSPKKEDAAILQKWINGEKFQKVPRETKDDTIPLYSLEELKRKIEEQWQVIISQQETIHFIAKRAPDINEPPKNGLPSLKTVKPVK